MRFGLPIPDPVPGQPATDLEPEVGQVRRVLRYQPHRPGPKGTPISAQLSALLRGWFEGTDAQALEFGGIAVIEHTDRELVGYLKGLAAGIDPALATEVLCLESDLAAHGSLEVWLGEA